MYYKLKPPYSFRGWKSLPYAIRAEYGKEMFGQPYFFGKEQFMDLLRCNGTEDVDISAFSGRTQLDIKEMLKKGMLEASESPMGALELWQIYRVYPARFMKGVHWAITGMCNMRCRHCLVSAPDHHQTQLSLNDLIHVADEIARCGIKVIDVTGGEPLMRKDFAEFCRILSERDLHIRVLFTNASLLNEEVLDMLRENGQMPNFQLSFDGLGHHDWLRGVPGSEIQADAAFRLLHKHEIPAMAAMMLHRENKDCLRDTVNYLSSMGVRNLGLNAPQNLGAWKQYSAKYALTQDEVWEVYREYIPHYFEDGMPIDIDLDGYFSCKKGSTDYKVNYVHHADPDSDWTDIPYCESMRYHIHIRPDGRVAPCMGFSDSVLGDCFPSVLDEHLGDITLGGYYYDVVETKLSDVLARNPECRDCEHWPECTAGCMVECMSDDGDYLIPDTRICHFHKHIGEAAVRDVADRAIEQYII
jgi:radical SAM protein with 4Fe4S-binding SPASM domain